MRETDDRTGGPTKLRQVTAEEAMEIEAAGIGGPKLYEFETQIDENTVEIHYFCEPAELEKWRAARASSQAGDGL
jgi:hypothetical protein